MKIRYLKTYTIKSVLTLKSGLRIGSGKDSVEIGGIDNPIVKHPHTLEPYIPGSSIKGKLRSLLEWALDCIEPDGSVWGSKTTPTSGDIILRTFGITNDNWQEGPSRLIVRDAHLQRSWVEKINERTLPLTEAKTEVVIDRLKGKAADNIGPRTMERIPAGAEFEVEMLFKQYSVDDDGGRRDLDCLNRVIEAMRLLEEDALGGCGSRGYGRVEFSQIRVDNRDITEAFRNHKSFSKNQPFSFVTE